MHLIKNKLIKYLVVSAISLTLIACNKSDAPNSDSGFNTTVVAAKVAGASCTAVLADGTAISANKESDADGSVFFATNNTNNMLISCSGGTYTDEATGDTYTAGTLTAAVAAVDGGKYVVSPLTDLAAKRGSIDEAIGKYNSEVARQFGLGTTSIVATVPTDLETADSISPDDSNDQYAIILAAISQIGATTNNTSTAQVVTFLRGTNTASIQSLIDIALDDLAANTASAVAKMIDATATATIKYNNDNTVVKSVTLADNASVVIGNNITIQATVLPANAVDTSVSYSSANTNIATVDAITGVITSVNVGITTISATANDGSGISDTISISVNPTAPNISTTANNVIVINGSAIGDIIFSNSGGAIATYAISPPLSAGLTFNNGTISGIPTVVTDLITYTVTASNVTGSDSATINISVNAIAVSSIVINSANSIINGATLSLTAEVLPANASNPALTWSIQGGTTNIATINGDIITAVGVGNIIIVATAADGSGVTATQSFSVNAIAVNNIVINSANSIINGATLSLTAEVLPANASNPILTWSIEDGTTNIATINGDIITAVGVGTIVIVATAADGSGVKATQSFSVNAIAVSSIVIDSANSIINGATLSLTAEVLPANATNPALTWSVQGGTTNIATINGDVITAVAVGNIVIVATAADNSGVKATQSFSVNAIAVSSIVINSANSIINGAILSLTANVLPANATNPTLTWSIEDGTTNIATINGDIITAVGVGNVIIVATAADNSGVTATQSFSVNAISVSSIIINSANSIINGATLSLTANVLPANASNPALTWSIQGGTTNIATINGDIITAVGVGNVIIVATAADGSGVTATQSFSVNAIAVSSIVIDSANSIINGATLNLTANVSPANASNPTLTWSIEDGTTNIATINGDVITAVSVGNVVIVATAADGSGVKATQSFSVNAIAVSSIVINSANSIINGATLSLTAEVLPTNASNPALIWSIEDGTANIATINGDVITAIGVGDVVIVATAADGSRVKATQSFSVNAIAVSSIVIDSANSILNGATLSLTAEVSPANASNPTLTWSIEDGTTNIATINGTVLTAVGVGAVVIVATATDGSGITATQSFSVNAIAVSSIVINSANSILNGATLSLTAEVLPANASNPALTWSIEDGTTNIATINGTVLTAVGVGAVVIVATATDGSGITATQSFSVNAIAVSSIVINSANSILNGATLSLTAEVLPANASNPALTWSIEDGTTNIATISGDVITAVGVGNVVIVATAADNSGVKATQSFSVNAIAVSSIVINSANSILNGATLSLTANVSPANASNPALTWSIQGGTTNIATINGDVLTAVGVGNVIIVATAADGSGVKATQSFSVNAIAVSSIIINSANSILNGATLSLTAEVLPANASNSALTWSIQGGTTNIATINGDVITAVGVGDIVIVATAADNSGVTATQSFSVNAIAVSSIVIDSANSIINGATLSLTANVLPANASNPTLTWSIQGGTTNIATINGYIITAVGVGTIVIVATAADGSGVKATQSFSVNAIAVSSIVINSANSIINGATLSLTANISPANASNPALTWSIEDGTTNIATINGDVITAVSVGNVVIVATAADNSGVTATQSFSVNAIAVSSIVINSANSIINGATLSLTANVSPANASNPALTWSIQGGTTNIATINGDVITAVGVGNVVIVATATDGSGVKATQSFSVNAIAVSSIVINSANSIINGATLSLTANVLPANATNPALTWSIEDGTANIATINGDVITAVGVGDVVIVATAADGSGVKATQSFSVNAIAVNNIVINSANSIINGATLSLTAEVLPNNATNPALTWSIQGGTTNIATINGDVITAVGVGNVIIVATATDGSGVKATQSFSVNAIAVSSIVIDSANSIINGATLSLTAEVLPANASNPTLTWSIQGGTTNIATINGDVITAVGVGTIVIVATAADNSGVKATQSFSVNAIAVSSIVINSANSIINAATLSLTAEVLPANASNPTLTWSIQGGTTNIATINGDVITAVGVGDVVIVATATDNSGVTATQSFSVNAFSLDAPNNLAAIATGGAGNEGDKVQLSWDSVTGATGYNIYRATATMAASTNSDPANISGVYNATATNVTATNHTTDKLDGNSYYFLVTATNAEYESNTNAQQAMAIPFTTVTSPDTAKVWMSRHLGAIQDCTTKTDTACYGDLYQWGRHSDGHQRIDRNTTDNCFDSANTSIICTSSTTTTRETGITATVAEVSFIANSSNPGDWVENTTQDNNNVDDDGALRTAFLSKTDGSGLCPTGFRLPSDAELAADTINATATTVVNSDTAFSSFLKLPISGYRNRSAAKLVYVDKRGFVWSATAIDSEANHLKFNGSNAAIVNTYRTYGFSVRCLMD